MYVSGPVDTSLLVEGKTEDQLNFLRNLAPLSRLGECSDIAKTIAFLVSDDGYWIDGQTIFCNGGFA